MFYPFRSLARRARRTRVRRTGAQWLVDGLEDRTLLASYLVTTAQDVVDANDGLTSLREAVTAANGNPGPDTIRFGSPVDGQAIQLNSQIGISTNITIEGDAQNLTTIDVNGNDRHFIVFVAGKLTLDGVELRDGLADTGGAIRNAGMTVIRNSQLVSNESVQAGGAIYNLGQMTVLNSTLITNTAGTDGGAIYHQNSTKSLRILNSTISTNNAKRHGGGVAHISGDLSIVSSTIVSNRADSDPTGVVGRGGGIYAFDNAQAVTAVNNTILAGNRKNASLEDVVLTTNGSNTAGTFNLPNSWASLVSHAATSGGLVNGNRLNVIGVNGTGTRPLPEIVDEVPRKNGGTTLTHAIVTTSVAIDAGLNGRAKDPGNRSAIWGLGLAGLGGFA